MFGISLTKIRAIGSIIALLLFIIQFNIYDSLNTQALNLELSGMRYDVAANGSHLNKLLFKQDKNLELLTNSANSVNKSLRNNMIHLGLDDDKQSEYLWELELLSSNIKGLKEYEEFISTYNKSVDIFLIKEYRPKIEELKNEKNFYRWSIIILTILFVALNFLLKSKTENK